jgi:DNA-binding CsgD family transcriptional regulator
MRTIAAQSYPDSIKALLSSAGSDTAKINLLLKLAKENSWADIITAEQYAKDALELSQQINYKKGLAYSQFGLSRFYGDYDFDLSEKLLLQSLQYATKVHDSSLMASIYCSIGNLKSSIDFPQEAQKYYGKSLDIFLKQHEDSAAAVIYNNLGVLHDMMYPDSLSNEYYLKAAEINKRTKNYLWLAMNYINIGINYTDMGFFNKAISYLNESHKIAEEHQLNRLLPWIYNAIGYYYLTKQDYEKVLRYADTALLLSKKNKNLIQQSEALQYLSEASFKKADFDNAYRYLLTQSDIKDSINKHNRLQEIDKLEMKIKHENELNKQKLENVLLEHKHYRKETTYVIIILAAVVIILFLLFLYILQRNKMQRKTLDQKNTQLEKEKLSVDLEYRNKELATNVMYLLKKNELISTVSDKLKLVINHKDDDFESAIEKIIAELDKSVSDLNWEDFEVRFQEVYVGFYRKLSEKYPSLTPNDLRMCAFLRLNMTSKEIADITFQSPESLKTARYRLRKKLGLSREDNLVAFLMKF